MEHKKYTLSGIRRSFGWTQEDLADELGVAVSTLSRWERKKTAEPVLAAISRKTNRRWQYVNAMVPDDVIAANRAAPGISCILHGEDFMVLDVCDELRAKNRLTAAVVGFPASGLVRGETKRVVMDKWDEIRLAIGSGKASATWWAPIPPSDPKVGIIKHGVSALIEFLPGEVIVLTGRPLSDAESAERPVGELEFYWP